MNKIKNIVFALNYLYIALSLSAEKSENNFIAYQYTCTLPIINKPLNNSRMTLTQFFSLHGFEKITTITGSRHLDDTSTSSTDVGRCILDTLFIKVDTKKPHHAVIYLDFFQRSELSYFEIIPIEELKASEPRPEED